jgi:hypothetical protein
MSKPPAVDILPEIIEQGFRRRKDILHFFIACVLVVSGHVVNIYNT